MSAGQVQIIAILAVMVAMFLWGRWRHDIVALGALLLCTAFDLVPDSSAFAGFGHPAVITVVCVLVLGAGLQSAGTVDAIVGRLLPESAGPIFSEIALIVVAVVLSAFINNVGALALLMPVALQLADRQGWPPGRILMPLAFGSILGGMTTLIGTPPNLIVSGFRQEAIGQSFSMFDFAPVGVAVAVAGVIFVLVFARLLVPARKRSSVASFTTGTYLTEARVPEESKAVGMTLRAVEEALGDADALVIALIRGERRLPAPSPFREIHAGDILLLRAEPEKLSAALDTLKLELEEAARPEEGKEGKNGKSGDGKVTGDGPEEHAEIKPGDIELAEVAVLPNAEIAGRSATDIQLRSRYGVNLLAVSRQGRSPVGRLRTLKVATGDVLLVQGTPEALAAFSSRYGCVPLAERPLNLGRNNRAVVAAAVMLGAILVTVFGWASPPVAFAGGVLLFLLLGVVSPREIYHSIDWPVVVLLGALIPVAGAMESTGAADLIARVLLENVAQGRPVIALVLILVLSMSLSDFMNNAATAAVMCPIALGAAARLDANADPFLMSVAVGASCAFLTPIGHQNNTLILGPGGFRFGDYWRLGLPLELIVIAVAVPMILWVWPL